MAQFCRFNVLSVSRSGPGLKGSRDRENIPMPIGSRVEVAGMTRNERTLLIAGTSSSTNPQSPTIAYLTRTGSRWLGLKHAFIFHVFTVI